MMYNIICQPRYRQGQDKREKEVTVHGYVRIYCAYSPNTVLEPKDRPLCRKANFKWIDLVTFTASFAGP